MIIALLSVCSLSPATEFRALGATFQFSEEKQHKFETKNLGIQPLKYFRDFLILS